MCDLTITCVQTDLKWEDREYNLQHISGLLNAAAPVSTDLILLPEMFSTGFTMEAERCAEPPEGVTVQWMRDLASRYNAAVGGSLVIREGNRFYNRFYWVDPDGPVSCYDKHHLFHLLDEGRHYTPGTEHLVVEYRGWSIQPFICYDLRFPVWCRNTSGADLQLFVANWPERRAAHWVALLHARAIENQCYVAGVNRVGKDASGVPHSGDSAVIDCYGKTVAAHRNTQKVFSEKLSLDLVRTCRERFPFLGDRDQFKIL